MVKQMDHSTALIQSIMLAAEKTGIDLDAPVTQANLQQLYDKLTQVAQNIRAMSREEYDKFYTESLFSEEKDHMLLMLLLLSGNLKEGLADDTIALRDYFTLMFNVIYQNTGDIIETAKKQFFPENDRQYTLYIDTVFIRASQVSRKIVNKVQNLMNQFELTIGPHVYTKASAFLNQFQQIILEVDENYAIVESSLAYEHVYVLHENLDLLTIIPVEDEEGNVVFHGKRIIYMTDHRIEQEMMMHGNDPREYFTSLYYANAIWLRQGVLSIMGLIANKVPDYTMDKYEEGFHHIPTIREYIAATITIGRGIAIHNGVKGGER